MAMDPNPQVIQEIMYDEQGTKTLITDRASDVYLEQARIKKKKEEEEKYSRFCGGSQGWNDWTERWHME